MAQAAKKAEGKKVAKKAPKLTTAKAAGVKEAKGGKVVELKQAKAAKTEEKAPRTRATTNAYAGKTIFLNLDNEKVANAGDHNPKRGKCREWFQWYVEGGADSKKGMKVEDYIAKGGKASYIKWDLAHELIKLS